MSASPTWRTGADAPSARPPRMTRASAGPGLPEQQDDPGHQQRLEQHVGHDRLFGVQLVGVEQHRRHRQRGEPARHAAAQHQHVERGRHGHPDDVLQQGHEGQVGDHQHRAQHQQRVAERVERSPVGVVEVGPEDVLLRVDEQQRGLVPELGDDAQHQPGGQQQPEHPVPAHDVHGGPDDPVEAGTRSRRHRCPQRSWLAAGNTVSLLLVTQNPCHESHQAAGDAALMPGRLSWHALILPHPEVAGGTMEEIWPVSSPIATGPFIRVTNVRCITACPTSGLALHACFVGASP